MNKREFKLLLLDHDKLDGDAVSYVHRVITAASPSGSDA